MTEQQNCSKCGIKISDKVHDYSMRNMGKSLCVDCQKLPDNESQKESQNEYSDWRDKIIPFKDLLPLLLKKKWKINNELLYHDENRAIFKSTITDENNDFIVSSHGDASREFADKKGMSENVLRTAETRAMSRAIRIASNNWDSLNSDSNGDNVQEKKSAKS